MLLIFVLDIITISIMKKKQCKQDGCDSSFIWSKGYCRYHYLKEFPSKGIRKETPNSIKKRGEKKEYTLKQTELFLQFYKEHSTKKCFECGCNVDGKSSGNFHHFLEKGIRKYKKYALEIWNLGLVCLSCHSSWHMSGKGENIKNKTEELKEIYG